MNKIVFSYTGTNGHTVVYVNGQVVARDYCLLNSVALLNFIVADLKQEQAACNLAPTATLFIPRLDKQYDILLNPQSVVNVFLHVQKHNINTSYVQSLLERIVAYCEDTFNTSFEVEWRLDNAEIYGPTSN